VSVVYVHRAVRQTFAEPARLAADATNSARLHVYLTDMLAPYGQRLDRDVSGVGQSYGEMAESLIAEVVGPGDEVDLLVLAFAVPDLTPGRATATYLSHVCPGNPLAFAICDQGRAAAFTGLRIIREYLDTGGCRRALLVVVEQADLPYRTEPPAVLPAGHTGVALLLGTAVEGPACLVAERTHPDLSVDEARTVVDRDLVAQTLIVGAALAGGATARVADDGRPFTGVWCELADEIGLPGAADRLVVLADYDDQLRYLCTATFVLAAVSAAPARSTTEP
jgi:4-hydroxymandelate oxidase